MLPKAARLRTRAEFDALFKDGRAWHSRHIGVRVRPAEAAGQPRIGFLVGKRVSAKATVRNRTKRRLRALVAKHYPELTKPADIAVIAHSGSDQLSSAELDQELTDLLKKAKLLR